MLSNYVVNLLPDIGIVNRLKQEVTWVYLIINREGGKARILPALIIRLFNNYQTKRKEKAV